MPLSTNQKILIYSKNQELQKSLLTTIRTDVIPFVVNDFNTAIEHLRFKPDVIVLDADAETQVAFLASLKIHTQEEKEEEGGVNLNTPINTISIHHSAEDRHLLFESGARILIREEDVTPQNILDAIEQSLGMAAERKGLHQEVDKISSFLNLQNNIFPKTNNLMSPLLISIQDIAEALNKYEAKELEKSIKSQKRQEKYDNLINNFVRNGEKRTSVIQLLSKIIKRSERHTRRIVLSYEDRFGRIDGG